MNDQELKQYLFRQINKDRLPCLRGKLGLKTYLYQIIDNNKTCVMNLDDVTAYADMLVEEHGV